MDPGFTEFQVIIGVSVILGLAFLALVFEHMRSKEASLREFNIELQVRQEERERNKPIEAVEWLQHLLGAKQATLRVSRKGGEPAKPRESAGLRESAERSNGAASAKGLRSHPAAPVPAETAASEPLSPARQSGPFAPPGSERRGWRTEPEESAVQVPAGKTPAGKTAAAQTAYTEAAKAAADPPAAERPASEPAFAVRPRSPFEFTKPIQSKPIDVPSIASVALATGLDGSPLTEPSARPRAGMEQTETHLAGTKPAGAAAVPDAAIADPLAAVRSHSRLAERLHQPDEQRTRAASSLLSTLPMPAWLRKEQEEKAAARSRRDGAQVDTGVDAQSFGSKPEILVSADAPQSVASEPAANHPSAKEISVPVVLVPEESAPVSGPQAIPAEPSVQVPVEPVLASVPKKPESFWSYRGLLDRVVAATGERGAAPGQAEAPPEAITARMESDSAVEIEPSKEPAPEVVLIEVAESARHLPVSSPASAQASPSVWPASATPVEPEPAMAIATVTMEVPEHPMQDVVEPEPVPETAAELETVLEPELPVADFQSEPVLLLVEEYAPLPTLEHSQPAPLESDSAQAGLQPQAGEPEFVEAETAGQQVELQPVTGESETSSLFLVSPEPDVEEAPVAVEVMSAESDVVEPALAAEPEPEPLVPEVISALHPLDLPIGFHHREVLDDLLRSTAVVNGVVVVIGINDYAHHSERMGRQGMQEWMASVETMVRSLLTEKDFGCRSSEDEFVLVFPGETGTAAQRRLNAISERLWSFQLRSLGAFSVIFCWGAVEIQGETLADATASASERMYQTKRNRKGISMESGRPRKAVNL